MAKNIYVGNLKWEVTNEDLLQLFGEFGKVAHAQVITNKDTGRPRGFGFVVMEDEQEALKAIAELNGVDHLGRPLTVNEAKPREEQTHAPEQRGSREQEREPRSAGFRSGYGGGTDRGRRY